MAEVGCLKDGHFQNLQVENTTIFDIDSVILGGSLEVTGASEFKDITTVSKDTPSTSSANGALIVEGGVGIAKKLFVGETLNVDGLLNTSSSSSDATGVAIDLTAITHDHKLLMTGEHSAFVKLPQAATGNVGLTIEVFVKTTVAADAAGSQIAVEHSGDTVFIGGYTTCIVGGGATGKESTSIGVTSDAKAIVLNSTSNTLAGGSAGSRFKFTYVAENTIFVEGLSFVTGAGPTAPATSGSSTTGFT